MTQRNQMNNFLKAFTFWGVFMVLFFLYKFVPVFPFSVICGVLESNFQHYKAGFFSYLIVNLLEYLFFKKQINNLDGFVYSRLCATTFLPWFMFLLWYLAPAIIVRWPNNVYEIVYSNIITIVVGFFVVIFEQGLQQITYARPLKMVLITLFLVSILLYIIFTQRLPWADVFVEPQWR